MTTTPTVGDMVAEFLQQCEVDTAFGVISVHNIPMLDAIGRRNRIRFVPARGEPGAGHMADAYARVTDRLGVLFTSTGPGAANAAGALVEARFGGSPVLHITGQTATANIDRDQGAVHDVPDQLGMLRSVSKAAYRVRSAETALGVLTRAAVEALTPPMGPVSVEIPIDIQRAPLARAASLDDFALPAPSLPSLDPTQIEALTARLRAARRPLLWLGGGARHAGEPVRRLAELGIPVVTSWNGRGVIPEDHPLTLGPLNAAPEVEAFYQTVDLLVVAGSRLRGHETRDMTLRLPENRIQIDVDPAANGRTYTSDLFVIGDSAEVLAALAGRIGDGLDIAPGYADEVADVRAAATAAYRDYLGPYKDFADILRAALPHDGLWVRDVTLNNSTWGNRTFPLYGPRDSVYPIGAAIGPGLPFAIGAAFGAGERKVLAMSGDGGFGLSLADLWTAVQERTAIVLLIMNDQGYGVIKHIQDRLQDGRHFFGDIRGPDLKGLAALTGMPYWRVAATDELGPAVSAALDIDGPTLVEVDMAEIGPFPPYFAPPPYTAKER